MSMYTDVKEAFDKSVNIGKTYDRNIALIPGWVLALSYQEVLVYPKARVDLVKPGDTAIPSGYTVIDTVMAPNSLDGFVICL